jgi:hypothetical protein
VPTLRTVTVKASGGDYSSLSAAEAGEQGDLVSLDRQTDIACYAMTDTTQCTISGWTMDATRYLRVYSPSGERHAGVWDSNKYNLTLSTSGDPGGCLVVREAYTRIEYLQVRNTKASPGVYDCVIYNDVETCLIDGCIARDGYTGIYLGTSGCEMRNGISYGCAQSGAYFGASGGISSKAYNCTFIGVTYGLEMVASGVYPIATNVYAHGGTKGFFGQSADGGYVTKTNCMSSDTTATIDNGGGVTNCTNSIGHNTTNFTNVTGGSESYLLPSGSALINAGTDLSGTFTNDINGTSRPQNSVFDIGADEYVAPDDYPFWAITAQSQRRKTTQLLAR